MSTRWRQNDIPNQNGKVVLITGANSGLGLETSRAFAGKGAIVVMAVRSLEKGEAARAEILALHPNANIDLLQIDMASLKSIRNFAGVFKAKYDRLNILANNAGLMALPYQETEDGFEMQLGVNHLGHFALTGQLLDLITSTPSARIHNVSSSAHWTGTMNFDDLMGKENYGRWSAYGQSKLANVFFTFELQKRLKAAGFDTLANSSHPGLVMGQLQDRSVDESGTSLEGLLYRIITPFIAQNFSMGVLPMLYGMTAPEARGGAFYGPAFLNLRGGPKKQGTNREANDAAALTRLWQVSEILTGVSYLN